MDFSKPARAEVVERTAAAVRQRGILVEVVEDRKAALDRVRQIIPAGASVNTGASVTLREIGLEDLLISKNHPWRNLKDEVLAEKDPTRQAMLRKQGILADYFLGSVHAIAETGELVIASATGSQLAPYAFSASNVIWVAGAQKITPTVEDGLRRIREYIFPHEDKRMKDMTGGKMGSKISKILIFQHEVEFLARKVTLLLVREAVGD